MSATHIEMYAYQYIGALIILKPEKIEFFPLSPVNYVFFWKRLHIGDQRNVKEKRQSQFAVQILIILKNVSKIWLLEEKLLNPPGMAVENI